MPHRVLFTAALALLLSVASAPASAAPPDRATVLDLARRGWNYQLRTTMLGRDMSIPVRINGQVMAGSAICVVGEPPRRQTREVLETFAALMAQVSGKPLPMRYAGPSARGCGTGRTVVLRLYSRRPPNDALTDDLRWMNDTLALGLPRDRRFVTGSPAMAQTFFGRRGQGTHMMIKQPPHEKATPLEAAFHRSILIEELFQAFTFGMDILHVDRDAAFTSKLEEFPVDLRHLPWESRRFMEGLLRSNPPGLCDFDIFMLHAVARAPVENTTEPAFLEFIDAAFDDLSEAARATLSDTRFGPIRDPECRGPFD